VAITLYSAGPQQDLLQEGVGDHVLDDDLAAGLRVLDRHPRAAVERLGAELALRERVAPVAEGRPRCTS
jgi:hypothetical protein